MSTMSLCLGFLQLAGTSISPPPQNIQKLIHERVTHQWQQSNPSAPELRFDDTSCPIIGYYSYSERSVTLSADSKEWRGPLEVSLTSLLEGEKIPFENVLPRNLGERFKSTSVATAPEAKWKSWLPWTLTAIGIVSTTYVLVQRERHVRQLQGLSLRF